MITQEYSTNMLTDYINMVKKITWKYSKKYHYDYEELESQAYLVFCEALKKHDSSLASFSTYLYIELQRLSYYCVKQLKRKKMITKEKIIGKRGTGKTIWHNVIDIDSVTVVYDFDIFERILDKLDYEISLSNDAKDILQYILSREWEDIGSNRIPRFPHIKRVYNNKGWTGKRIINSWNEIRLWWQGSNKDQFSMEV